MIPSPIWDAVGAEAAFNTPWQSCHHSPSSLPASHMVPPTGQTYKGRSGMLPSGVHRHLVVDQHGLQGLGLTLDGAALGTGSGQA